MYSFMLKEFVIAVEHNKEVFLPVGLKCCKILWQDIFWFYKLSPCYRAGPRFNIKTTSYQYRKSHYGDKTILRPSYHHNGISYTGKTTSLYWIGALFPAPVMTDNYLILMNSSWDPFYFLYDSWLGKRWRSLLTRWWRARKLGRKFNAWSSQMAVEAVDGGPLLPPIVVGQVWWVGEGGEDWVQCRYFTFVDFRRP